VRSGAKLLRQEAILLRALLWCAIDTSIHYRLSGGGDNFSPNESDA